MVEWYHLLNSHEFEQTPGDGEAQGSLAFCSPWGPKEWDTTEWLKNNKKVYDILCSIKVSSVKFSYVTSIYSVAGINFSPSTDILEHLITFVLVYIAAKASYLQIHGFTQMYYFSKSHNGLEVNESHSILSYSLRPHGLNSPWNSPGQNTEMGNVSLLQGIFPTQGSNSGLLHFRQILYQLSHKGSPTMVLMD